MKLKHYALIWAAIIIAAVTVGFFCNCNDRVKQTFSSDSLNIYTISVEGQNLVLVTGCGDPLIFPDPKAERDKFGRTIRK